MYLYLLFAALFSLVLLEAFILFRRRGAVSKRDLHFIISEWKAIRSALPGNPRHAILEADKLLDFVLKKRGYQGSLGDKLRAAERVFKSPQAVWDAHKLRNRVAHEMGFSVTEKEAGKAFSAYKQALWDLGVKN